MGRRARTDLFTGYNENVTSDPRRETSLEDDLADGGLPAPKPAAGYEVDPRVLLASQRNLLSWIRTGIALMAFGFVVARFGLFLHEVRTANVDAGDFTFSAWIGTGLLALGVLVNLVALIDHVRYVRKVREGVTDRLPGMGLSVVLSIILILGGIGMIAYVISLGR